MPKLVLKSELTENVELLTQIAEKLGFEVSVKEEKFKKKDKSNKKDKSGKKGNFTFSKRDKAEDVLVELEEDEEEDTETTITDTISKKKAKVKVKNSGKEVSKTKGYYEMDDDFMKDF